VNDRPLQLAGALAKHTALGLVVVVAVAAPWSVLIVLNLRVSPHVPWALPAGVAYVVLAMAYLNGSGWPGSTSSVRRSYFRARPLALAEFSWALLAGLCAITSLWLLFAASGYLSAQSSTGQANLSPTFLVGAVVLGAAVTAIAEEGGLRGFMQMPLECLIGPTAAVATTSIVFVLIHLSHGLAAVARFGPFYFAAGCVYGLLAYLTQSIVPSLLLHFVGDLLVFGLRTSLVHVAGPRATGSRAALVLCGLLAVAASGAAFVRLARMTAGRRVHRGNGDEAV
jgi:membrane protease YdiL (CAAX protease family)